MYLEIIKVFKCYYIFGFIGILIFVLNIIINNKFLIFKIIEQVFGRKFYIYIIVNVIYDGNVLLFRIDYLNIVKVFEVIDESEEVFNIKCEEVLLDFRRILENVKYVLEYFV